MSVLPRRPRMPLMGLPAGSPRPTADPGKPVERHKTLEERKEELIKEFGKLRNAPPASREKLKEQAIESACGRVVEAMRYGANYEEVFERVKRALDEELCRGIHDE